MLQDSIKRLSALIYIRVIVVSLLLGSFFLFRISYERLTSPEHLSYFVASLYFLTVVYLLIINRIKSFSHFSIFAYVQIVIDTVAETLLIHMTGGVESMFSFLIPLTIISAAIILNRRACYVIATISSILYALLLDLQFYEIISSTPSVLFSEKDFFYNIFAHVTAFYLIAFLSGYLSDKLHRATKTLQERDSVLSDLKAFSRYIIESMPSGVFTTDMEGSIITFNHSAQQITRLTINDVTGRKPEEIFPFLKGASMEAERIEGEISRNGDTIAVGMRLSPLRDSSGSPIGTLGVFQDLTQFKAMEAEVKRKEKWAFIGELSTSIAHELRNPLAALKGSIEMLREKKVSEEHAVRLMNIALSEMDRLNGIISDFLLYARPREINREPLDIGMMLREIATLLRVSGGEKKNVTIDAETGNGGKIPADAKQLRQVFWNLGTNAVDAVQDGGKVTIKTSINGNMAEVTFSDNGPGIGPDDIDKIFYPFYTTKDHGTGLGLAIAQKIVEDHGGRITVQSGREGGVTTFKVQLPVNPN
jgi:two-component system sensor histidine kinase PilS (NtrC family)